MELAEVDQVTIDYVCKEVDALEAMAAECPQCIKRVNEEWERESIAEGDHRYYGPDHITPGWLQQRGGKEYSGQWHVDGFTGTFHFDTDGLHWVHVGNTTAILETMGDFQKLSELLRVRTKGV